ncbi:uncharacterized protein LOC62_05G007634 [Vanrija pseudolonga]|uniref:Uncharacterized protein n=1 Tax=Vanrija pseudolonga TaxID=143232 RepID=A0AAF0YCW0_9TREE|nr:hypothetical protein LOC62_05G007634 [Vanrija pseudolonga]
MVWVQHHNELCPPNHTSNRPVLLAPPLPPRQQQHHTEYYADGTPVVDCPDPWYQMAPAPAVPLPVVPASTTPPMYAQPSASGCNSWREDAALDAFGLGFGMWMSPGLSPAPCSKASSNSTPGLSPPGMASSAPTSASLQTTPSSSPLHLAPNGAAYAPAPALLPIPSRLPPVPRLGRPPLHRAAPSAAVPTPPPPPPPQQPAWMASYAPATSPQLPYSAYPSSHNNPINRP